MKNKKVIRLTESDLHHIIAESVKQALNELDARTYASAAYRAQERNDPRTEKFSQAAVDRFNSDYEVSNSTTAQNGMTAKRNEKLVYDPSLYGGNFAYDTHIETQHPNGGKATYYKSRDVYPTLMNQKGCETVNNMRRTRNPEYTNTHYAKGKGWK